MQEDFDEGEESDLSFIVKDEEYDPMDASGPRSKYTDMIQKLFRRNPRQNFYEEESDISDMEADYDQIEEEETRAARIAQREDAEQLRLIQEEEKRERLAKKRK